MSRRTHACLGCQGRTRHDDQVCAGCRRRGVRVEGGQLLVPYVFRMLPEVADVRAPTATELQGGVDLTRFFTGPVSFTGRGA